MAKNQLRPYLDAVLLSGGFDPIHIGHIRMIRKAGELGPVLIALNSDEWLVRKKGYYFQPWLERMEILQSIVGVVRVVRVDDSDGHVCAALRMYRPGFFGNGGDRTKANTPELTMCEVLNISPVFGLGGAKVRSSSKLVRARVERTWGHYEVLYDGEYKIKILTVLPGLAISRQTHTYRAEHWIFPSTNNYRFIDKGERHELVNDSAEPIVLVEVQTGEYIGEDDIQRYPLTDDERQLFRESGRCG